MDVLESPVGDADASIEGRDRVFEVGVGTGQVVERMGGSPAGVKIRESRPR